MNRQAVQVTAFVVVLVCTRLIIEWASAESETPPTEDPIQMVASPPDRVEEEPGVAPSRAADGIGRRSDSEGVPPPDDATPPADLLVRLLLEDGRAAGAGYTVTAFRDTRLPERMWRQLFDEPESLDPWFVEPIDAEVERSTGIHGTTEIPRDGELEKKRLIVVARSKRFLEQGIAAAVVPPNIRELELTLATPTALRVRVIDAEGRPAPGVPVAITSSFGHAARWGESVTNEQGEASLYRWVAAVADRHRREDSDPLLVQAVIPLEDPLAASVPLDHDPKTPIELQLPETCELVVRVEGLPSLPSGDVGMKAWPKMPGDFSIPLYASNLVRMENGVARFPYVGLNYRFLLYVWVEGIHGQLERRIQSPEQPGAVEEVVLSIEDDMLLRARVLAPSGRALPHRHVSYRFGGPGWSYGSSASLNENSEFRLLVSTASVHTKLNRFEIEPWPQAPGDDANLGIRMRLSDGFQRGVTDLGDLTLEVLEPVDEDR